MIYRFIAEESYSAFFLVKADSEEKAREIAERFMSTPDGDNLMDDGYDGRDITMVGGYENDEDNPYGYDPVITEEDV